MSDRVPMNQRTLALLVEEARRLDRGQPDDARVLLTLQQALKACSSGTAMRVVELMDWLSNPEVIRGCHGKGREIVMKASAWSGRWGVTDPDVPGWAKLPAAPCEIVRAELEALLAARKADPFFDRSARSLVLEALLAFGPDPVWAATAIDDFVERPGVPAEHAPARSLRAMAEAAKRLLAAGPTLEAA